ncbi:UNVERIFIED_CONTAM: hypothetical protein PYX00_005042 [Menopon gallinae]|uniref:Uncharacterized protein n=1 Tax=Menopon gallinae TaxID=328185 RepID=A0AAW2I7P1_9NEOP
MQDVRQRGPFGWTVGSVDRQRQHRQRQQNELPGGGNQEGGTQAMRSQDLCEAQPKCQFVVGSRSIILILIKTVLAEKGQNESGNNKSKSRNVITSQRRSDVIPDKTAELKIINITDARRNGDKTGGVMWNIGYDTVLR